MSINEQSSDKHLNIKWVKDAKVIWDRKTVSHRVTRVPQFDSGSHGDILTTSTDEDGHPEYEYCLASELSIWVIR